MGDKLHYLCGLSYDAYSYNPSPIVERMGSANGDHVRGLKLEDLSDLLQWRMAL